MSFASDLKRFGDKYDRRARDFHIGVTDEVQRSVVEGSALTGAPGQPVAAVLGGTLKGSWIPSHIAPFRWRTVTNTVYAPSIEDLIGPHGKITIRSSVGGGHSVKLTRAGWQNIVDHVARRVARG